jgi:hypothetical protein
MKDLYPFRPRCYFALLLCALLFASCDPQVDGLYISESEAHLQLGTEKQAIAADGSVYRLDLRGDKLTLKAIPSLRAEDTKRFSQFGEWKPIQVGTYALDLSNADGKALVNEAKRFTFKSEKEEWVVKGRGGMLICFWDNKYYAAIGPSSTDCARKEVTFTTGKVVFNGESAFNFFTWEAETVMDDDGNVVQRRQLMGDVATATVPSDTGIEIIIVDHFTPENCCDETFLNCTEAAGEPVEVPPAAVPDGYRMVWTLYIGHACVYEVCGNIVVADQITGEIRCYDTEVCKVRIQHNHDGTFSVLLPSDCDTNACVTICPPKS